VSLSSKATGDIKDGTRISQKPLREKKFDKYKKLKEKPPPPPRAREVNSGPSGKVVRLA